MAMLSSSSTPCPCRTGVSDCERMVCLKDWWLVKAENRLVVAGISSHCLKLFTSQPIAKRHDMFTVEDAHGLTLTIQSSINRSRSIQNGFSPQACDHFLIGFPYYWHQYMGEESTTSTFRTNDSGLPDAWHTLNDGDFQRKSCKQKTENFPDDALKNSVSPVNVEVAVSSNVQLHAAEESLNRCKFSGPETTLNTSMKSGRDCSTEKLRTNMWIASKDCCVPAATISDGEKVTPSEGYRISPEYSSRRLMGLKKMESLTNQINAILSPKSKGRNMYASVPNDHSHDTKIHIKMKSCDVNSSNLSDINLGSVMKEIFASPDDNPTRSRRNCRDDIENDDASKDPSVGTDSVVNGANPSEVSSSRRLMALKKVDILSNQIDTILSPKSSGRNIYPSAPDGHLSVSTNSVVNDANPSEVNSSRRLMSLKKVEILSNEINTILSPRSIGWSIKFAVPKEHSHDIKIHVDKTSSEPNSSSLSNINLGSVMEEFFASPGGYPIGDHRNCKDDILKGPSLKIDSDVNVSNVGLDSLNVTPSIWSTITVRHRLKHLEDNGKKICTSNFCVKNTTEEPNSALEVFQNLDGKHLTGRSASITSVPSQEKMDKFEKMKGSVEVRRSSRLKKINTNIDCRLETERNEINAVSLCHDFGKHAINNLDTETEDLIARDLPSVSLGFDFLEDAKDYFLGESRDNYVMDLPSVGFQGSMSESSIEVNNESTEHVLQMGSLFSPHPTDSIKEQNHLSIIPGTEKIEQREFCMSTLRLDDACCTDYLKSPLGGEENLHSELRTSHKTTKRKLECITNVTSPPLTRNRRKLISCISPDYFSCKKSKSGRLLVPALDFWRNQQVVYDMDGQIVGVPKSMPGVETSEGSSSSNLT